MRMLPRSLATLLSLVALVAISLAAVVQGSDFCIGLLWLGTLGMLAGSLIGIIYDERTGRAWWVGFAIFGWGYARVGLAPLAIPEAASISPTTILVDRLKAMLPPGPEPTPVPPLPPAPPPPPEELLQNGADLFAARDYRGAAAYFKLADGQRSLLSGAQAARLDDYRERLRAIDETLVGPSRAPGPPPRWVAWLQHPDYLRLALECWCTVLAGCVGGLLGLRMYRARAARGEEATET